MLSCVTSTDEPTATMPKCEYSDLQTDTDPTTDTESGITSGSASDAGSGTGTVVGAAAGTCIVAGSPAGYRDVRRRVAAEGGHGLPWAA